MIDAVAHYMVEALFLAGHDIVVLDSTSISKKKRNEWKSTKWVRKYKLFSTSVATCAEQAKKDGRQHLIDDIESMAKAFEPLSEDEWDGHYSRAKKAVVE
jgi:hypothetical protein